jgi:hypothetical protein
VSRQLRRRRLRYLVCPCGKPSRLPFCPACWQKQEQRRAQTLALIRNQRVELLHDVKAGDTECWRCGTPAVFIEKGDVCV